MSEKAATVCCTLATNQPLACSLSNLSTPEVISMYHQCLFHIHMYQCIQQTVPFVQIPLLQTRKSPRLILGTHTPKVMPAPPIVIYVHMGGQVATCDSTLTWKS